jgi:hypothetical protein
MARTQANGLTPDKLREYARAGAQVTLDRLRTEIAEIEHAFPELKARARADGGHAAAVPRRRKRRMSAAARRAVSERMKRYWAKRRKASDGA